MRAVLGLDTSCYTTSCALAAEGRVLGQKRRLLTVEQGERGLMQSEGVFQHVNRLGRLIEELTSENAGVEIEAVCASVRPRPVEGSYMPVFTVGENYGRSIAAALRVPFLETTHQEGHIRAAMVDTALKPGGRFLALHLSGGTTEVIAVDAGRLTLVGGSNDLHAGQFIDRVGVRLGLPFPAGPELEKMAMRGTAASKLPIWVRGSECSFSGSESAAQRMIDAGTLSPDDMAAEVFSCVARSITKMLFNASEAAGIKTMLLAGGVASSAHLRALVGARMKKLDRTVRLNWGRPELSGDNACGPALIGWEKLHSGEAD